VGAAGAGAGLVAPSSEAPQLSQKASPGITPVPHCGQALGPAEATPAAGAGAAGAAGATGPAAGCALLPGTGISVAPHWSQKRADAGFSTPHWGQKGMTQNLSSRHAGVPPQLYAGRGTMLRPPLAHNLLPLRQHRRRPAGRKEM
jgi:hypothetical protein